MPNSIIETNIDFIKISFNLQDNGAIDSVAVGFLLAENGANLTTSLDLGYTILHFTARYGECSLSVNTIC